MRRNLVLLTAGTILGLGFAAHAHAGGEIRLGPWPPHGYAVVRAPSVPEVDGRLDDPAWESAAWTSPFVDIEGDRRPAPRHLTRAKMLWDDTYFYIGAWLDEPHLWATLRERDSIIFHDNDFEVFLDPDGDSHLYTEIELNALNTVWDLLLIKPYRDGGPAIHAWDIPGLRTAVHLEGTLNDPRDVDTGWSVEIAIPWSVLDETTDAACPPRPGDRWRLNFSRVQWQLDVVDGVYHKRTDPQTSRALPEDNWVWSPQREIAMHEPEYWGIVEFVEERREGVGVEPTAVDAATWVLRQITHHLHARRDALGAWPTDFDASAHVPTTPIVLDEGWPEPPRYTSDGRRFTLELRHADGTRVELDETGRVVLVRER